jgi:hypothetical protein
MGKISLGGAPNAADIMVVGPFNSKISADMILVLGAAPYAWTTLPTLPAQNGLSVTGATDIAIGTFQARQIFGSGLVNKGARVKVSRFISDSTIRHYLQIEDAVNSLTTATGDINVMSNYARDESYKIDASITAGSLFLRGTNTGTNAGALSSYSILNNSIAAVLFLSGYKDSDPDNAITGTVNMVVANIFVDPSVSLSGYIYLNGVALTTTHAVFAGPLLYLNNSLVMSSGADAIPRIYGKPGTGVIIYGSSGATGTTGAFSFQDNTTDATELFGLFTDGTVYAKDMYPKVNDTYYLGKNSSLTPLAWKGVIVKDTTDGNLYRIEVIGVVVTATVIP